MTESPTGRRAANKHSTVTYPARTRGLSPSRALPGIRDASSLNMSRMQARLSTFTSAIYNGNGTSTHSHPGVCGLTVGTTDHGIVLYADEVVILMSHLN